MQVTYFIPQVTQQLTASIQLSGQDIASSGIKIPFVPFGLAQGGSTSSIVVANATLYDITNFSISQSLSNFIVATTSEAFTLLPSGNGSNATTTFLYTYPDNATSSGVLIHSLINPTFLDVSTSTYYCNGPNNITDIGGGIAYGICAAIKFAFVPSQTSFQFLQDSVGQFEGVFPFNVTFGLANTVQQQLANASGTTDLYFTFPPPFALTVPILTSSTMSNAIGATTTNMIFTTFKNAIHIGTLIGIFKIITM